MESYIILDLETTGLSKNRHKITEIAAIKINNGKVIDKFETLVNPNCKIPSFITKLTGITNEMVKDKPTIEQILPHLLDFLKNEPIIAHNASFDYGFIETVAKINGYEFKNEKICTRKLANRLLPQLQSKRLNCICEYFNITNMQAHRAMSDVVATNEVFFQFLNLMKEMKIEGKEMIINFEKKPRKINNYL